MLEFVTCTSTNKIIENRVKQGNIVKAFRMDIIVLSGIDKNCVLFIFTTDFLDESVEALVIVPQLRCHV